MQKRLHLMHIFAGFAPGGAELRVTKIMNGMGPGVSHTVLALNGDCRARDSIDSRIAVEFPAAPTGRPGLFYFRELRKELRERRPDVVLTYNWGAIDGVAASVLGGNCPVIHNECGFGADESVTLKTRRVMARRLLLRRAYAVAVTSRTLLEICTTQFRLPAAKVRWIRTGVDVSRFRPGLSPEWRQRIGVAPGEVLFGFVGGFRAEKNLPFLLRAFAAAKPPHARLALIGRGPEQAALEKLAAELGIRDCLHFAGHVAAPEECLAALDAFVLPSRTEQTSNALLEAMACGLPAVVTRVGDSAELVGATEPPAVVTSGDTGGMAVALAALANSPQLRARLGQRNRQRCVDLYPLERMVREYETLYYAAAAGKPYRAIAEVP